jgi:hypothetical protein
MIMTITLTAIVITTADQHPSSMADSWREQRAWGITVSLQITKYT